MIFFESSRTDLTKVSKMILLIVAAILAIPAIWIIYICYEPFIYVFSGDLFEYQFIRPQFGIGLDQPTLGKFYILFFLFSLIVFPYLALLRFAINRRNKLNYVMFGCLAIALCLCLVSVLTIGYYWLIKYIEALGYTSRRSFGLFFGKCGYITVFGLLVWLLWPPKRNLSLTEKNERLKNG
ncbi:MAG: hypothetical protein JEZ07_06785 [Phycisphaerae bacterium]|nr:hypothetical protein [Phycisphaerae bacterium]